jgi:hypothetical protein
MMMNTNNRELTMQITTPTPSDPVESSPIRHNIERQRVKQRTRQYRHNPNAIKYNDKRAV